MLPHDPFNLGRCVWQLHGSTAKDAVCVVRQTSHGNWELMVIRADEALMTEYFSDANAAMMRATQIKDALIEKGWVQVPVVGHDPVA